MRMPQSKIWEAFQRQKAVSTDTRKIKSGDIFFALKGDKFDGNAYAASALAAGAAYAVVDDARVAPTGDDRYLVVPDVLLALQGLARRFRETFDIPFIAITGSNGKTTTKELVMAVLGSERRAYATSGNLNNHIGVPLTLLAMPADTEIAIIEMGANKPKDIEELVNIALPTHGLITNVGNAHLEGMGGIEGVMRTKGELFDFLRAHDGTAFVNENDPLVVRAAAGLTRRIGYGGTQSPFRLTAVRDVEGDRLAVDVVAEGDPLNLHTQLQGRHNAENVLAAVAVGRHFGISDAGIVRAVAAYVPRMNRSQLHRHGGMKVLLDHYNANPSSMEATLRSIALQDHKRPALILGDMFELGPQSDALHAHIWQVARAAMPGALIIGIGQFFHRNRPSADAEILSFPDVEAALPRVAAALEGHDFVLLKGSRGMALERLLPSLGIVL
jgi:UDP-N-acetylmuramoyl-tripeptide--D-alanyl-D-alanine ligase